MSADEYRLASANGSSIGGSAGGDVVRGPGADEYEEFVEHWKVVRHQLEVRHGKESIESLLSEFRQRCPNIPESERVYLLENALREFYGEPKPYHVLENYHDYVVHDCDHGGHLPNHPNATERCHKPPLKLPDAHA